MHERKAELISGKLDESRLKGMSKAFSKLLSSDAEESMQALLQLLGCLIKDDELCDDIIKPCLKRLRIKKCPTAAQVDSLHLLVTCRAF